jgi:hypothetical protein
MYYNYLNWLSIQNNRKGENAMEFEGYCVKCRKKQKVKNGAVKESAKGRKMAQGPCPVCKTTVTRFLPSDK